MKSSEEFEVGLFSQDAHKDRLADEKLERYQRDARGHTQTQSDPPRLVKPEADIAPA
jgi:hypothetical protein